MKIQVVGKNIRVTDAIREAAEKKISKMDKYFNFEEEVHARVLVRSYKIGAKAEVTIFTPVFEFRAEVYDDDLYTAIDLSVEKLEGQMRKVKTRMDRRKNKVSLGRAVVIENLIDEVEEENNMEVVRTKSIYAEETTLDEAIAHMQALGHSFYVYRDIDENKLSVVYSRNAGGYGVIEVENELK
ncbi:MAG: ribosome-associated translation inhibitor RaiA [Bacilli bacterium]